MVPRVSEPPVTAPPLSAEVGDTLGLKNAPLDSNIPRPDSLRRATAPDTPTILPPFAGFSTPTLPLRPRNKSPFTRGHARSRSSGGSLTAPQMARAHSSPVPTSTRIPTPRSASPLGVVGRRRSPLRRPSEEAYSSFGGGLDIAQTISENSELDLTPRAATGDAESVPASPTPYTHQTFPRSRRRPASPLSQSAFGTSTPRHTLRPCYSTPSLAASQFNESYPSSFSASYSGTSSIPSTPTSFRSRSPSISSLETIPDSPDAELEAEQIARLKAAADREDQSEEGARRRMVNDASGRGGARDKRKRWSVCGAEKRTDLSLETIWEG